MEWPSWILRVNSSHYKAFHSFLASKGKKEGRVGEGGA